MTEIRTYTEHELSRPGSQGMQEWTHRLEKVRRYRGMRTPIGIKIKKVVDARKAWTRILLSYSGGGIVAIELAARAGRKGEAQR
jgi:hypothetical protein